ncbi:flagellar transcriptional regulator FlhD [Ramlibacter sp. RBP-2]|uniref:Flagellar transcriptional regulator FlhD n=1 Tax=Ramlibacter lithotrophicus TaxID=2606681 RepID=A0A7X6DFF1_9BURK|nr:flagellar transcriptional regulator FlhD [Ramlibacter lithotrophicus]NKE66142.1 flagellar transcriptional regulator FlhD [Ramlibacter lithotrophicus]
MFSPEVENEITDLNIAYLLLAQKLLREDRAAAMLQLGIDRGQAQFIGRLAVPEILTLSSARGLLCGFRMGELVRTVLQTGHDEPLQRAHLFIVLAAGQAPAAA